MPTSTEGAQRRLSWSALAVALIGILLVVALPQPSRAATAQVAIRDNLFQPQELRIDPGDTVVWTNQGTRTHSVTSDTGAFNSTLLSGETFSRTFNKKGYYFYHCRFHGAKNQTGQWGVVIVGNLPPPPDPDEEPKDERTRLVVPRDFNTIQKAVDAARPRAEIVIRPGVYREAVVVTTPGLLIRGVDRFRTILNGQDTRSVGITVDGVDNVTVQNLTVRDYLGSGVFFVNASGYTVTRVDSIKNRSYGIYAFNSYDGVVKDSFAWGSGDAGLYIGQCLGCSALVSNVTLRFNYVGYSGTNATGVTIRNSTFSNNGAGIVPNTYPNEALGPNRGTFIYGNTVTNNNYRTSWASPLGGPIPVALGTGIWLMGTHNNIVLANTVTDHDDYGILVSESIDDSMPVNNEIRGNTIRDSDVDDDGYGYDLAWDGTGRDNCFSGNDFIGATGPPDIETLYSCEDRPFAGVAFEPVQTHLAAALQESRNRELEEPPEPQRPRCQRGRPGCNR